MTADLQNIEAELDKALKLVRDAGAIDDNMGGEDWSASDLAIERAAQAIKQLCSSREIAAKLEQLERLKVLLARFTWGPYNPFEVIDEEIAQLKSTLKGAK